MIALSIVILMGTRSDRGFLSGCWCYCCTGLRTPNRCTGFDEVHGRSVLGPFPEP